MTCFHDCVQSVLVPSFHYYFVDEREEPENIVIIAHKYEMFKNSAKYYVSSIWNKLPPNLKNSMASIGKFRTMLNRNIILNRNDRYVQ